ncbi:hypothetical protein PoB_003317500 [Plakobranchus ocellatus]|uniref:Uncharacterized protein n=1 Tax=Plakobranchus ocellatus TaxID=259542 RepID=A0AAV4AER6_9GAST|nr:hypothetical protein PoB_003317500 [Plakobranchus ocellatus]
MHRVAIKVRKKRQGRLEASWMDDIRRAAGPQCQRKAQDRRKWKTSAEGYILQWMDKDFNPLQGDIRLSGPPRGQGAGRGARTRKRRVPADIRADKLTTVPPTPLRIP